jgi:transmembrane sensor
MTDQEADDLLKRYANGQCTPAEQLLIESWHNDLAAKAADPLPLQDYEQVQQRIWSRVNKKRPVYYWRAAAAVTLLLSTSTAYLFLNRQQKPAITSAAGKKDILPGTNKAILTLSNGKQINLDDAAQGAIASQGGINITKNRNGQIVYHVTASPLESNAYNTISTPNGGQYQIILPDGSKVYLNAASSLKYPVRFTSNERKVTLTGEGYFEVAKNVQQPFIVATTSQTVKVLGTHFNVSCYPQEPVTTTLAEGKIEISQSASPQKTTLQPGDQSIVSPQGIEVHQVNPDDAIAWKDGLFIFRGTKLSEVFRQLARWYDVDVDYATIPDLHFEGEIPRNMSLLKVLTAIEKISHVQFTLEGKKITRE